MTYPDGRIISVGDLIWWNEGQSIGYIQAVVETAEDQAEWDQTGPFIFITNLHPFDSEVQCGIAYDVPSFEDEGIGLLNSEEIDELRRVTSEARAQLPEMFQRYSYSITTEATEHERQAWIFTFLHDGRKVDSVRILAKKT